MLECSGWPLHRKASLITAVVVLSICMLLPSGADAAWPGHNGRIAFVVTQDDGSSELMSHGATWRVVTVRPNGSRPKVVYQCTQGGLGGCPLQYDQGPQYSPDGRRMALGLGDRIAIANADGTDLRVFPRLTSADTHPVWSRDGRRIAFVSIKTGADDEGSGPGDVYTVRTDGTGLRRLTTGAMATGVAWSRRGQIAYSVFDHVDFGGDPPRVGQIVSIDANGGDRKALVTGGRPSRLDWSPDGRTLLFTGEDRGRLALRTVSATGRNVRTVIPGAGSGFWSPDGRRIIYGDGSRTVRPDGSGLRRIRLRIPTEWGISILQSWQPRPR